MAYSASWIPDSTYIIGDSEYGYDLCRVEFYRNLREILSSKQQDELADDMVKLIIKAIERAETEG